MKNIVTIFLFTFTALYCQTSFAQKVDTSDITKLGELKEYREELFVQKLQLTTNESKAFFPIYDAYQIELRDAKKDFRRKWVKKDVESLNESDSKEYFNDAIALQQKEVDLLKSYSTKLATVIPYSKVIKLKRVEREVRLALVDRADDMKLKRGDRRRKR